MESGPRFAISWPDFRVTGWQHSDHNENTGCIGRDWTAVLVVAVVSIEAVVAVVHGDLDVLSAHQNNQLG